jgi:hypothetical protein
LRSSGDVAVDKHEPPTNSVKIRRDLGKIDVMQPALKAYCVNIHPHVIIILSSFLARILVVAAFMTSHGVADVDLGLTPTALRYASSKIRRACR